MFLIVSIIIGCFTPDVQNPSGECQPESNGSRSCYHSPARTDTYLLDCQNQLDKELWRVFAQTEESAYIIPRPDGVGVHFNLCEEGAEHAELFQKYRLCDEILDAEGVEIINDILPADALLITNILHQKLQFEVGADGVVFPWAPEDDMIEACDLIEDSAADDYCDAITDRSSAGECLDIKYIYSEEEAELFAEALNEIYGID